MVNCLLQQEDSRFSIVQDSFANMAFTHISDVFGVRFKVGWRNDGIWGFISQID